jgi:nitrate/nitrite transport system ATP-binding protein
MAFLELQGISKGYGRNGSRTEVLRDINLQVEQGEFVAIVGYSGSGKTTLMSIVAGLLRADAGAVRVKGREITGPGPDRGIVFQNYSLLPWMTVYNNVYLAVDQIFADWPAARKRQHAEHFISMVNLSAARDKKPQQLSGGMRQRVSLARALAMDPDILLLDEPLGALDALTRATLQDEIGRIWREDQKTVVLITNDIDEAILMADRIVPLTPGPGATFGREFRVTLDRPRDRKTLNSDPEFKQLRNQVTRHMVDCGAQAKLQRAMPVLELPDLQPAAVGAG